MKNVIATEKKTSETKWMKMCGDVIDWKQEAEITKRIELVSRVTFYPRVKQNFQF